MGYCILVSRREFNVVVQLLHGKFPQVFDHTPTGKEIGEQLLTAKQGGVNAIEYVLELRILTAGSGWNETALKTAFHKGLNHEVLTKLACHYDKMSLDSLIDLAICLDHLIHSHHVHKGTVRPLPQIDLLEPIQLGKTRLSTAECKKN